MNFYEENLKLFQNVIPTLYDTILYEKPIVDIKLEYQPDISNCIATKEDKKCFIHSVFDINQEMIEMFKNVDKDVNTLIIFGVGCGHAIEYVKDNLKGVKNLLILEPSLDMFKIFIGNNSIHETLKAFDNFSIIVNKDVNTASYLLLNYTRDKITKSLSTVFSISYRTLYQGYFEMINDILVDSISKVKINLATTNFFREQWTYNSIKNSGRKAILIDNIFDDFKNKSAIIVSAGPSLNKNIDLIKYAKDKALIVAVGTASKILESKGIKPHLRFAMDSQMGEKVIFDNLQEDNSILVFSDRLYHEVAPLFKRKIRMILDVDELTRYLYTKSNIDFHTITSGFSIANTTLDALIKLGFENIIFLGQDLCYTKDRLYADGSWLKEDKLNLKDGRCEYIEVKDIYGADVYTQAGFLGVKTIFEGIISSNPNVNYINATEGGIGIEGTKIKTFQQVLDEDLLEKYDYDNYFDDLFINYENEDNFEKVIDTILDLERVIDEMNKINESRIASIKAIDKHLEMELEINKIEKETVKLDRFEVKLRKIDLYNRCVRLMLDDIYKVILITNKYEGEDPMESILNSKKALKLISNELKTYLFYFKVCIEDIKANTKKKHEV